MNLFLLTAVPLAAVAAHRLLHSDREPFADWRTWILGSVWSLVALIAVTFFGRWRIFTGDLTTVFLGMTATDVLLAPGIVVAAWLLTRPAEDAWELGLWLALVFAMAGIRDFASTSRTFDLNELFLVPIDRILIVLTLPSLLLKALGATILKNRVLWWLAASGVALTGSLFPLLSFAGWGWVVWILEAGGLAAALWLQKKAAPRGSGLVTP